MSLKILEEFFTCPICMEILENPITTICGHNYCKKCINQILYYCPICKKEINFSESNINYQLKNIIESLSNLDNTEIKNKFFPEIKQEETRKELETNILLQTIFGDDFSCNNYQCKDKIKSLIIKIKGKLFIPYV